MMLSLPRGRIAPVITSMASSSVLNLSGGLPAPLGGLNPETPHAPPQGGAVHRDAVHGDAVERRLVPLRVNVLAQRSTDTLRQRQ